MPRHRTVQSWNDWSSDCSWNRASTQSRQPPTTKTETEAELKQRLLKAQVEKAEAEAELAKELLKTARDEKK